jgi:hypothetical protein
MAPRLGLPVRCSGGTPVIKKRLASLLAVAAIGLLPAATSTAAPASTPVQSVAQVSRTCGYGTAAWTPGGVKCLGPGEYCSHKPGYAAAYREAGLHCNRNGRLEYR